MLKYEAVSELVRAAERDGVKISELVLKDQAEAMEKTPMELFDAFFEMQNGQTMSAEQKQYVETLIEKIWEGDK